MNHDRALTRIVEEAEYLVAKQSDRWPERLRLVIVHGHHQPETACLHGETLEFAYLVYGPGKFPLSLSPTGLAILDCLAAHRQTPFTAAHIERILASDPFYVRLGANAATGPRCPMRARRRSIKVFIERIRRQLGRALAAAGLAVSPAQLLVSDVTDSNVVAYRLDMRVSFTHCDASSGMRAHDRSRNVATPKRHRDGCDSGSLAVER